MKSKPITVEWWDAASLTAWMPTEQLPSPVRILTSGFLAKKTPQYIVVCGSKGDDKSLEWGDCIAIPRPWIAKVTK